MAPSVAEDDSTASLEPQFRHSSAALRLTSPVRLVVTPNGYLLVSDYYERTIVRVDPITLQPDQAFEVAGRPVALGLGGGHIFVGNATERTVDVFSPSGRWRSSFGRGAVRDPVDLDVDAGQRLVFVADGLGQAVKVFSFRGSLERSIGDVRHPTGIAVDAGRREVLVSDYGDLAYGEYASLKIFDYQGGLLASISGKGDCGMVGCTGGFSRPQGVAVDGAGRIYLVDCLLGQVLIFDRVTLRRVGTFGAFGDSPGQLLLPQDVVLGPEGTVFVTSYKTARVERYMLRSQP